MDQEVCGEHWKNPENSSKQVETDGFDRWNKYYLSLSTENAFKYNVTLFQVILVSVCWFTVWFWVCDEGSGGD